MTDNQQDHNNPKDNVEKKQYLTDQSVYPDNTVIAHALGADHFKIYLTFIEKIEALNLVIEWRYYNDGKSWLGKIWHKKKNMGWLSIWEVGFKVTIFFTEKTIWGLNELEIDRIETEKPVGKLIPILMTINDNRALDNAIKILQYKMQLK